MRTATMQTDRLITLDAMRGFAVMSILAMNIVAFAMPFAAYVNPLVYGSSGPADFAVWAFNFVFVDSKMRGLFSLLFGASTLLVIGRAKASDASEATIHYARMFWLFVFGCLHFYLIWFGDILVTYAISGCILYVMRHLGVAALWRWAIGFLTAQFLYVGVFSIWMLAAIYKGGPIQPEMADAIAGIAKEMGPDAGVTARELALYGGDYAGIFAYRTGEMLLFPFEGFLQFGLETLGLMSIGMALFKSGCLTGEWEQGRYRRWAAICMLIALPSLIFLAYANVATDYEAITGFATSFALSMPFDVLMTIAYACLLVMFVRRFAASAFIARVAATGRAAFTNYLGTSILMTTIFYGYGLGLFGEVGRAQLYIFVVGAWAVMLLWSKPWLAHFRYGPLEWLWRSLARMELQPMRR